MNSAEERRKHKRRPIDTVLQGAQKVIGKMARIPTDFACQGVNASTGGMQLLTSAPLETGQRIKLSLRAEGGRSLTAEAEVRWVRAEKNSFRVGVMFLEKEEGFVV